MHCQYLVVEPVRILVTSEGFTQLDERGAQVHCALDEEINRSQQRRERISYVRYWKMISIRNTQLVITNIR